MIILISLTMKLCGTYTIKHLLLIYAFPLRPPVKRKVDQEKNKVVLCANSEQISSARELF